MQFCITKPRFCINLPDEAKQHLNNTIQVYKYAEELLFIIQVAYVYLISKAILYYKINSYCNQLLYRISKEKLTFKEDKSIKNWVLEILSWRFSLWVLVMRNSYGVIIR